MLYCKSLNMWPVWRANNSIRITVRLGFFSFNGTYSFSTEPLAPKVEYFVFVGK